MEASMKEVQYQYLMGRVEQVVIELMEISPRHVDMENLTRIVENLEAEASHILEAI